MLSEDRLHAELQNLPNRYKCVFACLVIERLLAAVDTVHEASQAEVVAPLRRRLDAIWDHSTLMREEFDADNVRAELVQYTQEDISGSEIVNDVAAAAIYAIDALNGDNDAAVWAAQRGVDGLDHLIVQAEKIESHIYRPNSDQRPEIRDEKSAQESSLTALADVALLQDDDKFVRVAEFLRSQARHYPPP